MPEDDIPLDYRDQCGLVSKTAWDLRLYFPTIFLRGTIGLITASLVSKLFPPEHYGNYVLAYTVYLQLTLVTGNWISHAIIRLTPQYQSRGQFQEFALTLMNAEAVILASVTVVATIVLFHIGNAIDPQLLSLLTVAVLGALFLPVVSAIESFYRISDHPAKYCVIVLVRILFGLGLGFVLGTKSPLGVVGFLAGLIIPNACLVIWFACIKREKSIRLVRSHSFSKVILRDAILFSFPLVAMNAMAAVLIFSDRYLINWYLSAYEVGIYSIGYIIAHQAVEFVVVLLRSAGDPIAMRTWEKEGSVATCGYLSQLFRVYSLLVVPTLLLLIILGKDLIHLFSTSEYIVGAPIIGYVGVGVLFSGYTQILNIGFCLRKKTVYPLINFVAASAANVILNILLIPKFGYVAAAWSTLASYVLLFALTLITSRRVIYIRLWGPYLIRILMSSGLMGVLLYLCESFSTSAILNITISIVMGVLFYTFFLILLGEISVSDVQAIIRKIKELFLGFHGHRSLWDS